ncbi:MAG: MarR family transcriptional regulator, partial [Mucispirillum sp.]|nr:MarR family transcriptional regulator [Mucispirillum sp.]
YVRLLKEAGTIAEKLNFLRKRYNIVKEENRIFAEWCGKRGVHYADVNILDHIFDSGGISEPSALAEEMLIPKQTVTNILDRLEKAGYIERVHSKDDRRKINVVLLDKGAEFIGEWQKSINEAEQNLINEIGGGILENMLKDYRRILDITAKSILKDS